MAYYALDFPYPAYDYDYAGNITAYDGYVEDCYTLAGHPGEGNVGKGHYDDDYIYAS